MARIVRSGLVCVILQLACLLVAPPAGVAATLTVTDCGDSGAAGQLRTLIGTAQPGDAITLPACTIPLTGAKGPLTINQNLTMSGAGRTLTIIDGSGATQVFAVTGGTATISDLTIRNGRTTSADGGGINNGGTLTLTNTTVSGNTALNGGGIYNSGVLTVTDSTISGNTADLGFFGGGIANFPGGTLTVTRSAITGNVASGEGGGIENRNMATATVVDSAVSGNTSSQAGGAIVNFVNGTLTMRNSTVSGNTGAGTGGGGIANAGTLTLTNVTVSGNIGTGTGGGGIVTVGTLEITNSTISENHTDGGGGGLVANQGVPPSPTATLRNTILAKNTSGSAEVNCAGSVSKTSLGHNLDSGSTCGFSGSGDRSNVDPMLGPLQKNGGFTQTHALLPGSPAIDAGDNVGCPATDQRGVPRPLDGNNDGARVCDIGASEFIFFNATLALSLSRSSVRAGDPLHVNLSAANPGPDTPVDVYLGFLLPASAGPALGCPGDAAAFVTSGFASVAIHCLSSSPAGFPKLFANLMIPAGLPATDFGAIFSALVPAGTPTGPWSAFMALTPANALVDDSLDLPQDILTVAAAGFTVNP